VGGEIILEEEGAGKNCDDGIVVVWDVEGLEKLYVNKTLKKREITISPNK
jgi:hypothetical protein